jgi:hypothetical protein
LNSFRGFLIRHECISFDGALSGENAERLFEAVVAARARCAKKAAGRVSEILSWRSARRFAMALRPSSRIPSFL